MVQVRLNDQKNLWLAIDTGNTLPSEGKVAPVFSSLRGGLRGRGRVQGLLGYDVLKNFIVTFDYRSVSMVLELPGELEKGH